MTLKTHIKAAKGNGPRGAQVHFEKKPEIEGAPWHITMEGWRHIHGTVVEDWFTTERLREFAHNILHLLDQPKIGDSHAGGTVVDLDDDGNPLVELPNKERIWVREETLVDLKPGDWVRKKDGFGFFTADRKRVVTVERVEPHLRSLRIKESEARVPMSTVERATNTTGFEIGNTVQRTQEWVDKMGRHFDGQRTGKVVGILYEPTELLLDNGQSVDPRFVERVIS